jgi:hypothetical protein
MRSCGKDSDDDMPAAMPVAFPDVASSSHTVPPSESEGHFSQIMKALAALQGGMSNVEVTMSTIQQSISTLQLEVRSINKQVEQTHLDLQECLQVHHPDSSDDKATAPRAARRPPRTTPMAEDVCVSFCFYFACCLFCLRQFIFMMFC